MNKQVNPAEVHPEDPIFHPNTGISGMPPGHLELALERAKTKWRGFTDWQQWGMIAGAVVLVALLLIGVTVVRHSSGTIALVQKVQTTSTEVKSAPSSIASLVPSSETLSLIQMEFDALRDAANQNSDRIDATNTVVNKQGAAIKSIEESLKENPKVIQAYKDDIEKVRKVMAKPHVELVPFN